MNCFTYLLVALWALSANATLIDSLKLRVKLANGHIHGRDNENYISFESIPYAQPPLGKLRFEPPRPYTQKFEDDFDATQPPISCMQWSQLIEGEDKLTGSEDCLTLSIYKPKSKSSRHLPVIVDIPGGFFTYGGASNDGHEIIMANGKAILVKINYRLGPLGFLSTGDATLPGNLGLKDQRLALKWIKENISKFGGDPQKILVIGQDAGGASVHLHLLNENFNQLASAAASISGNALNPWVVQKGAARRAFDLGRIAGCDLLDNSRRLKECLKTKDASDIVRAVPNFQNMEFMPFTPFGPVIEPSDAKDPFLTQHPLDILKSGKYSSVRWLASYTEQNGGYNAAQLLQTQYDGSELLDELNRRWLDLAPLFFYYRDEINDIDRMDDHSRDIRQLYMQNELFTTKNFADLERMFTDILFKNGLELSINLHRRKTSVFSYLYSNPATNALGQWLAKRNDIPLGTIHGDDYSLIFNNTLRQQERPDETSISWHFVNMLTDFANEGRLQYDKCELDPNLTGGKINLLHIQRNKCEKLRLNELP